jgi:ribosome-associated protein
MPLQVSNAVSIPLSELDISAIRSPGPGGQNVNKVSSAIHLRFDFLNSPSLPDASNQGLQAMRGSRITSEGVIVIKAQRFRSQEKNREDALERLLSLLKASIKTQKKRVATKPTKASKTRRLDGKARRGKIKSLRGKVQDQ